MLGLRYVHLSSSLVPFSEESISKLNGTRLELSLVFGLIIASELSVQSSVID